MMRYVPYPVPASHVINSLMLIPSKSQELQREREWERKKSKMAYKKNVVVKVAILLFIVGVTATSVDARFDPETIIDQLVMNGDDQYMTLTKSTTTACCDACRCTKSMPPQCRCKDVGVTCHSACKTCVCTLSIPPQCHCADTTTFCYDSCSDVAKAH